MSAKSLGICVIGSGRAGMIHARNYATGIGGSRLVALVDPVESLAVDACRELAVKKHYLDYHDALADAEVDAVVVATPTQFHPEVVLAAARAGKHVFCEKPMALNVADCDRMIAACQKAAVKLQIGFMRRFDRSFRELKSRIDEGEIGEVVQVRSVTHGPSVPQPWMVDIHKSNGLLAEINSHDIDTLRWYTGSEFEEVYALAANFRCGEVRKEYPDFYDTLVMTVRFQSGAQGCIDGAASVGYGYDARVEVLGTQGILFAGQVEDSTVVAVTKSGGVRRPAVASWRGLFGEAYRTEAEAFVQAVVDDREPEVTGNDGKMAVKIVNAGNRSILEKRPVRLPDVGAAGGRSTQQDSGGQQK